MAVYRRGKKWRAVVDLPRGADGRRNQLTKLFATKREAEEWEASTRVELSATAFVEPGKMTVGQYLQQWLDATLPSLKHATRDTYTRVISRWTPVIGEVPLAKLTPLAVQRAVNALATELSAATVRGHYAVLRTALKQAHAWGLIRDIPTRAVRLPRDPGKEMRCWTETEAGRFLAVASETTRYCALFRLALASGMRIGELLGLRWQDVDWQAGTVRVAQCLSWPTCGEPALVEPKSRRSRRVIDVDPGTMKALRQHQKQQAADRLAAGPDWPDRNLVFVTRTGSFVKPLALTALVHSIARKAGVPDIRFHDLRHTHATLLLRAGRNLKEVSDRLGHSDPAITLRCYAHVLPDQRSEIARVIGNVLDGTSAGR